jgi:hypothetical protein
VEEQEKKQEANKWALFSEVNSRHPPFIRVFRIIIMQSRTHDLNYFNFEWNLWYSLNP